MRFPATITSRRVVVPDSTSRPPAIAARLFARVLDCTDSGPLVSIPPPFWLAVLLASVLSTSVSVPRFSMPPPLPPAALAVSVTASRVRVPPLRMPPPLVLAVALPCSIVRSLIVTDAPAAHLDDAGYTDATQDQAGGRGAVNRQLVGDQELALKCDGLAGECGGERDRHAVGVVGDRLAKRAGAAVAGRRHDVGLALECAKVDRPVEEPGKTALVGGGEPALGDRRLALGVVPAV